jgi:dihydrofolate reductase
MADLHYYDKDYACRYLFCYDRHMINAVVAYDKNYGIGANNVIPWGRTLSTDMRHFKLLTYGQTIIMGQKTLEFMKGPLPDRQNIVLSRELEAIEGATVARSLQAAYDMVEPGREIWVIGGGQIFKLAMDSIDRIYATEVDAIFPEADVFFPKIDPAKWHELEREHHEADERNKYAFDFVTYERI